MIEPSEEFLEFCQRKTNWFYFPKYYWDIIIDEEMSSRDVSWKSFWEARGVLGPFLDFQLKRAASPEQTQNLNSRYYGVLQLDSGAQSAFSIWPESVTLKCVPYINYRITFSPQFVARLVSREYWGEYDDFQKDSEALAFHRAFLQILLGIPVLCAYAGDQGWCRCICGFMPAWRGHLVCQESFHPGTTVVDEGFCAVKLTDLARN